MKLTRNPDYRTSPGGNTHQPKRPFFKLATVALLAGLAVGAMALPKHAAAQETRQAAADTSAIKITNFRFFRVLLFTFGLRLSPIRELRNVPPEMRYVPVHPDDIGIAGYPDSSWSRPIYGTVNFPSDVPFFLDLNLGPGVYFNRGKVVAELGAGAEVSIFTRTILERNYLFDGKPVAGDSLSWERGYGTALTYYAVAPSLSLPHTVHYLKFCIKPYLFAEIRRRVSTKCLVGLGYRLYQENFVSRSGWDRYDSFKQFREYRLANLTVGMPYVLVGTEVESDLENPNSRAGHMYLYIGFKHMIKAELSDLAKQADFVSRHVALTFGVSTNMVIF